jgi:sporulation protein YlmC with PRC-barrel domain
MLRDMRLELGERVRSSDDVVVGELADVIIDPVARRLTHLVVKPPHGHGESRLVTIETADPDDGAGEITLRCSASELNELPNIEEFAFVRLGDPPVADPDWDVGVTNVLAYPYYESSGLVEYGVFVQNLGTVYDRIPKGEVEIRRTSSVVTADGQYVGDVDGFLVDGDDGITHVVLERGHLWGRREVTVPIGAVTKVESDTVTVALTKEEIGALPTHKVHRWLVFGHK